MTRKSVAACLAARIAWAMMPDVAGGVAAQGVLLGRDAEENHPAQPQLHRLADLVGQHVGRQLALAGHGRDRLAQAVAGPHEQGQNQVGRREPGLADQLADRRMVAKSPQSGGGKCHVVGHIRRCTVLPDYEAVQSGSCFGSARAMSPALAGLADGLGGPGLVAVEFDDGPVHRLGPLGVALPHRVGRVQTFAEQVKLTRPRVCRLPCEAGRADAAPASTHCPVGPVSSPG